MATLEPVHLSSKCSRNKIFKESNDQIVHINQQETWSFSDLFQRLVEII